LTHASWQDWLVSTTDAAERLAQHTSELFAAGSALAASSVSLPGIKKPGLLKAIAIYSPCFHYDGWNVPFYHSLLARFIGPLSRLPFLDRVSFAELPSLGIKDPRLRQMVELMSAEGILDRVPAKGLAEMHRLSDALKTTARIMHTRL
jgi:carboxylesterase